jgi:hypothetical protein
LSGKKSPLFTVQKFFCDSSALSRFKWLVLHANATKLSKDPAALSPYHQRKMSQKKEESDHPILYSPL